MGKKMQGSNSNGPTKAGKKHQFKEPAQASQEKYAARVQGEQQFIRNSNKGLNALPHNDLPFVELAIAYGLSPKRGRNLDTGYRWDENRKRVIVPDGEFANGY